MATLKLVLRKDKIKKDGTAPIYLRITQNRRSSFISTDIHIEPNFWNPDRCEVRRPHPLRESLNDALKAFKARADEANAALGGKGKATAKAIRGEVTGSGTTDLFSFMEGYADEWKRNGKYWEFKKVHVLINKLKGYSKRKSLTFADLDRDFIIDFRSYMRTTCKNMESTQEKGLGMLRAVVKRAVIDGVIPATQNHFAYYKIGTTKGTRDKLDLKDIHALEALSIEQGSPHDVALDVFLFAFYASGMRFGDVCCLRWENVRNGRLHYTMMKSGREKAVKLKTRAEAILSKYRPADAAPSAFIFPLLDPDLDYSDPFFLRLKVHSKTAGVNAKLKDLAKQAEIEINLTTHVARHTFADLARKKSNGNIDAVSKALGHTKIQTTQTYLRSFDQDAEDGLMDTVFD